MRQDARLHFRRSDSTTFLRVPAAALAMALMAASGSCVALAEFAPTLQTDRASYAAGDEVAIIGHGFAPDEAVTLSVTHADGTAEPGMGHEAWTTAADATGAVDAVWRIDAADLVGRQFVVQAAGSVSRTAASPVFTRGPRVITVGDAVVGTAPLAIEGRDFNAGETVTVQVTHIDGTAEPGMAHDAFTVTAAGDGAFWTSWAPSLDDSAGSQLQVTASGTVSGAVPAAPFRREGIIEPDKGDYQPGETVRLAGSGFVPGEVVKLQVTHVTGRNDGSGHEPFYVNAGADGAFAAAWYVNPDDSLHDKFRVAASGQASGVSAAATFWDAGTVSLTTVGTAYTENFSTLASTGTSSTVPAGWDFAESGTNANTTYSAGTGSSNAGDTYSFGASGSTDRAWGGLQSGSLVPTVGAQFTNNTGTTITALDVAYTGEMWRAGVLNRNAADRLDFQWSVNATSLSTGTWVDVNALDYTSSNINAAVGALDGNATANRTAVSATLSGLSIANGATFWIRWTDFNITSSDDGLAVDDFSLTAQGVVVADSAPTVSSTTPANLASGVALAASLSVTFSEPVTAGDAAFTLACTTTGSHAFALGGGPISFSLDPTTDFAFGETCTLTVLAAQVADQDGVAPANMAADHVARFATVLAPIAIHEVQGASHLSPKSGQTVTLLPAVVTAVRSNGFYLQDPTPDADDRTSEGLFVFTNTAPTVRAGDSLQVTGIVTEFRAGGALSTSLTTTELTAPVVATLSTGNALPAPIVIGAAGRTPPTTVIEDDAAGDVEAAVSFDPASDGIDFYESLEGMRVQVNDALVVGPTSDFTSNREIQVLVDNGAGAGLRTARGGIVIQAGDFNPERVVLNDLIAGGPALPAADVGDAFPGATIGVIDYSFGNFKLQVSTLPARVGGGLQPETTVAPAADQLAVATFNVENLAPGDPPAKFARLAALIVNNLKAPDVLAIEEIQDNNGTTNNGTVSATTTWSLLIAAIQSAGGPSYSYRQLDPLDGQDGGAPGGNIRQGFLFRIDRGLAFVDRAGGTSTSANGVVGSGAATQLLYSPGRIAPVNAAFNASRKPLAGEFTFRGERFFVIANHFNSKGGDEPLFGRYQPPRRSSEVQRHQQAQIVHDFVDAIVAADPAANVVVLGDLNDFEFSETATILEGTILDDLMASLPVSERYSYVFEGNSQSLDHILLSTTLLATHTVAYDVVHVNAEFADQASDHDPQVARITVNAPPTVIANGPYAATEGGSVALSATGTDPEGDALSYAWDLDNNGSFETPGQTVTFSAASLQAPATYTVQVQATDAGGLSAVAAASVRIIYVFTGFFAPVDNLPTANRVKAGQAIPVKFSLGGFKGLNILASATSAAYAGPGSPNVGPGSPNVGPGLQTRPPATCTLAIDDVEETATAGNSVLQYDATAGQYVYVWKTDKTWAGQCRLLTIITNDQEEYQALFTFTR
ncbi:MAG TPA: PxKF domain-containing protein [Vicinamibacterales bacterium]|nr:PxKF domain-containing protein [Vicinamibacterales bacterium]